MHTRQYLCYLKLSCLILSLICQDMIYRLTPFPSSSSAKFLDRVSRCALCRKRQCSALYSWIITSPWTPCTLQKATSWEGWEGLELLLSELLAAAMAFCCRCFRWAKRSADRRAEPPPTPAELPVKAPEAAGKLPVPGRKPAWATLPNLRGAGGLLSSPLSPCLPVQVGTFSGAACNKQPLFSLRVRLAWTKPPEGQQTSLLEALWH